MGNILTGNAGHELMAMQVLLKTKPLVNGVDAVLLDQHTC
jgi:hypothetical protein